MGADGKDGFAYIFGSETASENDFVCRGGSLRDGPVERFPCTAEFAALRGVEKKVGGAVEFSEIGARKTGPDAKSFNDGKFVFEIGDLFGRFVAVELHGSELKCVGEIDDDFRFPIDEDADGLGGAGEFAANIPGIGGGDGSRGLFVEIESQGVSAEFFGEAGVLCASDAADFDERAHGVAALAMKRFARTER